MLATVNTDASFSRRHRKATYAFWSVFNNGKIQRAGRIRGTVNSSCEAEAKCILNAIHKTLSDQPDVTKVIINTDSLNAISIFENNRQNIRKYKLYWGEPLMEHFEEIKKNNPCVVYYGFRHVKAHSGVKDARSYVNEWCDEMAKNQMDLLITEIVESNKNRNNEYKKGRRITDPKSRN